MNTHAKTPQQMNLITYKKRFIFSDRVGFNSRYVRDRGFPGGTSGKVSAYQCRRLKESWVQSLGWEDPMEEDMATHSSILAWRIPWTEGWAMVQRVAKSQTRLKWPSIAHMQGISKVFQYMKINWYIPLQINRCRQSMSQNFTLIKTLQPKNRE